jgi:hypothetical protein
MSADVPSSRPRWNGPMLGWAGMALGGLTLGATALESARTAALGGASGVRLALRLPDALLATVFGLLFLAAVLLLLFIFQGSRRRRRKKGDEPEFQLYYEPPKVSPWAVAVMLALALLPVALLVYTLRVGWVPGLEWEGLAARPSAGVSGSAPAPDARSTPASPERPVVGAPAFGRSLSLVLLAVAVGTFGLVVWLWLGDRLAWWWWGRPGVASPPAAPLIEAIDESLDDLAREPDARRAVILCYRRFEWWLGDSGVPRAPWETPMEFLRRALGRLPIPAEATVALTRLFELSRFSHHALGAPERDAAVRALTAIRAALEVLKVHAPAA